MAKASENDEGTWSCQEAEFHTQQHTLIQICLSPPWALLVIPLLSAKDTSTHLPELFQLVDLLGSDLTRPQLLLLGRDFDQPGKEAAVLNQRLPLRTVPVDVLQAALTGTRLPV